MCVCVRVCKLVCRKYKIPGEGVLLGDLQWRNPRPFGQRHQAEIGGELLSLQINRSWPHCETLGADSITVLYKTCFSDHSLGAYASSCHGDFKALYLHDSLEGQGVWTGRQIWMMLRFFVRLMNVQLKEHPERGVYVRDLSMHTVHSVGECERIIEQGWRNRAVGYTLMNKDSSRSHSIFTIHLEICSTGGHTNRRRHTQTHTHTKWQKIGCNRLKLICNLFDKLVLVGVCDPDPFTEKLQI